MANTTEGRLGIERGWALGQSGQAVCDGLNKNFRITAALLQMTVKSLTLTTPPASPSDGDIYIVPAGATGAWASKDKQIAAWDASLAAWFYLAPKDGFEAKLAGSSTSYRFDGTNWVAASITSSQVSDATTTGKALMTAADAAAVRSTAGLSNHEKVTVDASGNATVPGSGAFGGSGTFGGDLKNRTVTLRDDCLENWAQDTDTAVVAISYNGFGGQQTRYRDFKVYDGKGGSVLAITGASKASAFWGNILPSSDNTLNCGTASNRWKEVFAGNNVINTSDARVKTTPRKMTDAEIAAASDLAENIGIFQYLDAVAEKGEAAREHVGMTVQSAIAIMEAHGLDPHRYGFICHDEWDELTEEVEDPTGDIVRVTERQVTRTEPQPYSEIRIIDGVPTLITGTRDVQVPVTEMVAVVDEAGEPVVQSSQVPVTRTEQQPYSEIQIIGGTPTLVTGMRDVQVAVVDLVAVVDEAGAPVLQHVPAEVVHHEVVTDAEGKVVEEAHDEVVREAYDTPLLHPVPRMQTVETPMMHAVPVMETAETRYSRKVTRAAGDLYSFRTEQLNLFIARGLAAATAR